MSEQKLSCVCSAIDSIHSCFRLGLWKNWASVPGSLTSSSIQCVLLSSKLWSFCTLSSSLSSGRAGDFRNKTVQSCRNSKPFCQLVVLDASFPRDNSPVISLLPIFQRIWFCWVLFGNPNVNHEAKASKDTKRTHTLKHFAIICNAGNAGKNLKTWLTRIGLFGLRSSAVGLERFKSILKRRKRP